MIGRAGIIVSAALCGVLLAGRQAFAGGALDEPPPGIQPTAQNLQRVLAAGDRAAGTPSPGAAVRVRRWAIVAYGLTGTATQIERGRDERDTITLGPFTQTRGVLRGKRWWQNENGLTVRETGIHQRDAIDERALQDARTNPAVEGVRLLGEIKAPVDAYLVEVHPPGGRLEWLFYEVATGRLVRKEAVVVDRRLVTTFDDFRTIGGVTEPWHYRVDDGRPANVEDWRELDERLGGQSSDADFAPPPDRRSLVEFPAGAASSRLPARFVNRKIVVRVTIAGRGLDFLLDSGASGIVIDSGAARSLGLQTFGKSIGETAGAYDETSALVSEMQVGDLRLRSVKVSVLPFEISPVADTKVVGLLGFDFIDSVVLRIDFERQIVDAFPAGARAMPSAGAVELAAALDDGVPDVAAEVGGSVADHFIFDTGATSAVVFSGFADAHREAVADEGLGFALQRDQPLQFAGGVGGTLHVEPTELKSFGMSGAPFRNFLAYLVSGSKSYEGEDQDGLMGYDYLRYFTVYLDEHRSRVALVRNGMPYTLPTQAATEHVLP